MDTDRVPPAGGELVEDAVGLRRVGDGGEVVGAVILPQRVVRGDHRGVGQRGDVDRGEGPLVGDGAEALRARSEGAGARFRKPVEAPVRRATVANLARLDLPFERLHDLRDRLRRIIAMEPVKVDHVRAEVAERGIEVRDDVGGA